MKVKLPIQLPEYWIKPKILFVYSNGKEKPREDLQLYECEEDMEPSAENARLMLERIPEEYRASVSYVMFQRRQPLQKVRYGQGELAEDGRVYVSLMEYSVEQTHVWLHEVNRSFGKPLAKPVLKKGTSRDRDLKKVYIK